MRFFAAENFVAQRVKCLLVLFCRSYITKCIQFIRTYILPVWPSNGISIRCYRPKISGISQLTIPIAFDIRLYIKFLFLAVIKLDAYNIIIIGCDRNGRGSKHIKLHSAAVAAAQIVMKTKARHSFVWYNRLRGKTSYKARGGELRIVSSARFKSVYKTVQAPPHKHK